MKERVRNAPTGVFTFVNQENEEFTYDWELMDSAGEFTIWRYFDGPEWADQYCACYKGRAFLYGESYALISDAHHTAQRFLTILSEIQ